MADLTRGFRTSIMPTYQGLDPRMFVRRPQGAVVADALRGLQAGLLRKKEEDRQARLDAEAKAQQEIENEMRTKQLEIQAKTAETNADLAKARLGLQTRQEDRLSQMAELDGEYKTTRNKIAALELENAEDPQIQELKKTQLELENRMNQLRVDSFDDMQKLKQQELELSASNAEIRQRELAARETELTQGKRDQTLKIGDNSFKLTADELAQFEQWKADYSSTNRRWYGGGKDPSPEEQQSALSRILAGDSVSEKKLTREEATALLEEAGGDKEKARQLARDRGYVF